MLAHFGVARHVAEGFCRRLKVDLSFLKRGLLGELPRRLSEGGWLWYLPLLLAVMPLWQAWHLTGLVPRADHWNVIVEPYLKTVDGGPLWDFFHSPGTDSRHDAAKLLHYLVIKGTGWSLFAESMVCVVLGVLATMMALQFWKRHPGPVMTRWIGAWITAFGILSPMQWMNWVWGIQICYTLLVAASVAMIWALVSGGTVRRRVSTAAVFAVISIFSFLNGWMVWGLGLAALVGLAGEEKWRLTACVGALSSWLAVGALAGWVYVLGWPEAKPVGEDGLMEKLGAAPMAVLLFFLRVLGTPFSELALLEQRVDRHQMQMWSAAILGVAGLVLVCVAGWSWWRRRSEWPLSRALPWILVLLFGLGSALAITVARVGKPDFLIFQSRYPSFTIWFWVGLLGLLIACEGRFMVWLRRVFLIIVVWGMSVGGLQGWRDGIRDARQVNYLEAAVAMRHAAVEPVLLDAVRPFGAEETIALLDRLGDLGLLHLARVKNDLVSESNVNRERVYLGSMTECRSDEKGIHLRGWALHSKTRLAARAVGVSYQIEGQPERWLGLATKGSRERGKAKKNQSRELDDRIGWIYEPLTGNETSLMTQSAIRLNRSPLPRGAVTIRAYGFDPVTGVFSPLEGETKLTLP